MLYPQLKAQQIFFKGILNDEEAALERQTDKLCIQVSFKDLTNIYCAPIKYQALS